eukprot:CAMPEP_0170601696 /NCGR_PEP_ID=MMETSP0224-20130122/17997_1 /TAXON_ID=285029 /ORGANISM="Togula jolla, Strain CCCM 725" /LENGTH=59 /DNA_ID=CAMNT_0010926489 /DNA_START=355 /DNA_END=530 /DNA_ORIENTATION=+
MTLFDILAASCISMVTSRPLCGRETMALKLARLRLVSFGLQRVVELLGPAIGPDCPKPP